MLSSLSSTWVETCNAVGNQATITVANYTAHHVVLTLEVAGVVYHRALLPPNESPEDDLDGPRMAGAAGGAAPEARRPGGFRSSNFAVVKMPCGKAWYTLGAVVSAPADGSEAGGRAQQWVEVGPKRRLHFVFGGSFVSLRYDTDNESHISMVNESTEFQNNEASERLEGALSATGSALKATGESLRDIYASHVKPSVEAVRDKIHAMTVPEGGGGAAAGGAPGAGACAPGGDYGSGDAHAAQAMGYALHGPPQLLEPDDLLVGDGAGGAPRMAAEWRFDRPDEEAHYVPPPAPRQQHQQPPKRLGSNTSV